VAWQVLSKRPDVLLGNKSHAFAFLVSCASWSSGQQQQEQPPPSDIRSALQQVLRSVRSDEPTWSRVAPRFAAEFSLQKLGEMFDLQW
jgi:hypothetical protein